MGRLVAVDFDRDDHKGVYCMHYYGYHIDESPYGVWLKAGQELLGLYSGARSKTYAREEAGYEWKVWAPKFALVEGDEQLAEIESIEDRSSTMDIRPTSLLGYGLFGGEQRPVWGFVLILG
ncbi:hypothetical protein ACFX11_040626 [Malus domestica]